MVKLVRHSPLTLPAPAKVNLFFELTSKREDGYHNVETLMVPLSLSDRLTFALREDGQIHLRLAASAFPQDDVLGPVPTDKSNLVCKAAEVLQTRHQVKKGCDIFLCKRIPSAAGLGGGSSDAATALLGLNMLWGLGLDRATLMQHAAALGSDVAFFLQPGPAICTGRGEIVHSLRESYGWPVVIVKPPFGLSTKEVYGRCQAPPAPKSGAAAVAALKQDRLAQLGAVLFNRLEQAASSLTDWIDRLRKAFEKAGCRWHQLSGSGSAYFGLFPTWSQAVQTAAKLKGAGLGWVHVGRTLTWRAIP